MAGGLDKKQSTLQSGYQSDQTPGRCVASRSKSDQSTCYEIAIGHDEHQHADHSSSGCFLRSNSPSLQSSRSQHTFLITIAFAGLSETSTREEAFTSNAKSLVLEPARVTELAEILEKEQDSECRLYLVPRMVLSRSFGQ